MSFCIVEKLEGTLSTSDEIEQFMWFGPEDDFSILSNTLKNEVIPFCIQNELIYESTVQFKK